MVVIGHVAGASWCGQFTAIMGPSGSGKSTLMRCLGGLASVNGGQSNPDETEITGLKDKKLTRRRRDRIGFVFQVASLLPSLNAMENITLPMDIAGRKYDRAWLERVVETVGLAGRLKHRPTQLAGGQQQRDAVARALAVRPEIIFGDERIGNLDSRAGREVLGFMRRSVRPGARSPATRCSGRHADLARRQERDDVRRHGRSTVAFTPRASRPRDDARASSPPPTAPTPCRSARTTPRSTACTSATPSPSPSRAAGPRSSRSPRSPATTWPSTRAPGTSASRRCGRPAGRERPAEHDHVRQGRTAGDQAYAALKKSLDAYPQYQVADQTDYKQELKDQLGQLLNMVYGLLALAIIVAVLGVVNTLALSVVERTREIGLMRAIGLSRRQLRRMIRMESVLIALFGALLGLGLGMGWGATAQELLALEGLNVLDIPWPTIIGVFIGSAFVRLFAALVPAFRAGRMNVLNAIATE
ncbi:Vitamin B12 import ATP-binding protein BtuD [Streptomyces tendae]